MSIFNNLDIIYEICLNLNYFERLPLSHVCHQYYNIVNKLIVNIEEEVLNKYHARIQLENYTLQLPFVDHFDALLYNKYGDDITSYNVKIKIDKNTFIIYSTGKIMYCCRQLDLNVIKKLCEQLYNDGIIYKVENINDIKRITRTCVFTHNINQFIIDELSKIYPTNQKSFKNCTTISVYNETKRFNYKLHKNGSILTSYGHFDNFFITFKMLLTSINDIKFKHHIYNINNL